jgi:hypothetical protein
MPPKPGMNMAPFVCSKRRRIEGSGVGGQEEGKDFFFAKKKQKTFAHCPRRDA